MDYLKIYTSLDSTNKEAQRLLATGPVSSGLTILARHQTAGHGQYGRTWVSAPDSHLAMSIVYKPVDFDAIALPTIGMKVSLGIIRALKQIDPQLMPLIKWPNDIYVNGKKLCGILIENVLAGSRVQHSIIGIGMNVNESQFPSEIPNATSLFMNTGMSYEVEKIALILRQHMLTLLEKNKFDWKNEYDQSLFGLESLHAFQIGPDNVFAKAKGVSIQGHLILEMADGAIAHFGSHELKWEIS